MYVVAVHVPRVQSPTRRVHVVTNPPMFLPDISRVFKPSPYAVFQIPNDGKLMPSVRYQIIKYKTHLELKYCHPIMGRQQSELVHWSGRVQGSKSRLITAGNRIYRWGSGSKIPARILRIQI